MKDGIRSLEPTDLTAVQSLIRALPGGGLRPEFHWPDEALLGEIGSLPGRGLWMAGELVAFVVWRDLGNEAEISILASDVRHQRKGWMGQLLSEIFNSAHYAAWILEVHEQNHAARELYRRLGFHEVGRRSGYYRDGGAALVLRREI